MTDCRGTRVGASLQDALGGIQIPQTDANLAVLSVQESGIGWCWAYVGDGSVYGVEELSMSGFSAAFGRIFRDNGLEDFLECSEKFEFLYGKLIEANRSSEAQRAKISGSGFGFVTFAASAI